jgi:signal transduction histidine kinase
VAPALFAGSDLRRRLQAVERAATGIADDLTIRVPAEGQDEIARLASAFNSMAEALEEARARREALELARRELFASISHDLRTPLSSMRVMIEALSDGVVDDDQTRQRYLVTVGAEIEHMSVLIDDLFELARLDSGELQLRAERIVLDEVVQAAVEAATPGAKLSNVSLRFEPRTQHAEVEADAQRLLRVLGNLLQNAIRHTPADGSVVVTTEAMGEDVVVEVADTGDGIPVQDLAHVFERFYRADKSRRRATVGSGLGLTISRAIVEAHGGRIWVHDTTPQGTVVRFALPAPVEG